MTQTPIQELLEEIEQACYDGDGINPHTLLERLQSLLPKEKEFNKQMFDAGKDRATGDKDIYPDFNTYYQQFEKK